MDESRDAQDQSDDHDRLVAEAYDELRRLARARLAAQPPGQTLQATALVHEALLRLGGKAGQEGPDWEGRRHLFFLAARAMRDILVERARKKGRLRHGGERKRIDFDELDVAVDAPPDEILALESALDDLDDDKRQLVELRFHAGLTMPEVADILGKPLRTLEREWRFTRARLYSLLRD